MLMHLACLSLSCFVIFLCVQGRNGPPSLSFQDGHVGGRGRKKGKKACLEGIPKNISRVGRDANQMLRCCDVAREREGKMLGGCEEDVLFF